MNAPAQVMTSDPRTGELCIGSARLPAQIVELAAEGALLRAAITRQAFEAQALKINGVGYLPVNAYKWLEDGLLMVAFDKPSAKVRRKLRQVLAGSDLDLAGPALAYLARN